MKQTKKPILVSVSLVSAVMTLSAVLAAAAVPFSYEHSQAKAEEKPPEYLAHQIHHQIEVLPFYSVFDDIEFHLDGNRVTLTGEVVRPSLKAHAESAVKTIEGVEAVTNKIVVLPASASDDDLRRAVYRAIYEDNQLKRYAVQTLPPIRIIIQDGNVALEGAVENEPDKQLAEKRAGSVPNVKGIQNRLVVKAK